MSEEKEPFNEEFEVIQKKNIVAVFAHPDDELSSIGTLAKHSLRGDNVYLVWSTFGEKTSSFPDLSSKEIKEKRIEHTKYVAKTIGAKKIYFLGIEDTKVQPSRKHALKLAKIFSETKPDAVITWDLENQHPDHRNTAKIVIDAVTYARLPKILENHPPHRKRFPVFHVFNQYSPLPVIEIDVEPTFEIKKQITQYYAKIYGWEKWEEWLEITNRTFDFVSGPKYIEKFNQNIIKPKPHEFLV